MSQVLCGIISMSGPNREPLACAYQPGHDGAHSWATLPTFVSVRVSGDGGQTWEEVRGTVESFDFGRDEALREGLAALAHEQWSGWMEYLFSKCEAYQAGTMLIPHWAVERWKRQMKTPYADLLEEEKESDRKEADRVLAMLGKSGEVRDGG